MSEPSDMLTPTQIATQTGLSWNRTRPSDVLTWEDLMELAHREYDRNRPRVMDAL